MDQGSLFMSHQVCFFAESLKIKLLSSSPIYAQANGQAESSNMTLIKLFKKKIEEDRMLHHKSDAVMKTNPSWVFWVILLAR
jgi:hypothetical protein